MDPFGDEEAATKYMFDTINEDTRANTAQQIGEEDARTVDSFLNMSGDGDEEDDDFALPPNQQHIPVRILIMHGDLGTLVLRLTYLFCNLVDLRQSKGRRRPTKKMEGRQVVTEVDAEGCPCAPKATSTKFVNQCGVIVRLRIPITTRLWKSSKPEEQQHAVPPH